jgi:hypothetical protein
MVMGLQHHAPAAFPPGKRPGTQCTGGWVGPRLATDRYGKSRPYRDLIPKPSTGSELLQLLLIGLCFETHSSSSQCLFLHLSVVVIPI